MWFNRQRFVFAWGKTIRLGMSILESLLGKFGYQTVVVFKRRSAINAQTLVRTRSVCLLCGAVNGDLLGI
jgi:hypothetical protein